jgi:hypothetical protein
MSTPSRDLEEIDRRAKIFILALFLGVITGFVLGYFIACERKEEAAIKSGAASYVCDPLTGKIAFQYNKP